MKLKINKEDIITFLMFLVIAFLLFASLGLYGQLAYGDWTCGYRSCVKVVEQ